jgi:uncharacterized zinc-type alcohol dehydrogenase-like protein
MDLGKGLLRLVSPICELWFNGVAIEVLYCGVCHSDLHQARNDLGASNYSFVLGHEIVGRVIDVSSQLKRYKVGDYVAVGYMVDSCRVFGPCRKGLEQLCREGETQTYFGFYRLTNEQTKGGYSKHIVLRVPKALSKLVSPVCSVRILQPTPLCACPVSVPVVALALLG